MKPGAREACAGPYRRVDPLQLLLILVATACCVEALRPFVALAGEVYWTVDLGLAALTARAELCCYAAALFLLALAPPAWSGAPTRAALYALLVGALASVGWRAAVLGVLRLLATEGVPDPLGVEWGARLALWHAALRQAHWCWLQGWALALVGLAGGGQVGGQWPLLVLVLCLWLVPQRAGAWFCVGGWALLHTLAWALAAVAAHWRAGALCWYRAAALVPALAALVWVVARPAEGPGAFRPVCLPHDVAWALATTLPDVCSAYRLLA
eukprot:g21974.t1